MDAVLNWLWQGAVVVLATAALLRVTRSSRAQARYGLAWVGLLSILVLPLVPLLWATVSAHTVPADVPVPVGAVVSMPIGSWASSALLIGLWALWSSVYAGRLAGAMLALRRAKRQCRPVPPDVEARLPFWTQVRTRGRPTRIVLSDSVRSAAVLGCGSPVIGVAPALLDNLEDEELDSVVIHEWAHVQRRDDFANAVQLCVRVMAGWHPGIWWMDRQLLIEREMACDETAVAVTGSAKRYAACLAKLASLPATPLPPLPAVAVLPTSGLRRRIVRILSQHHAASPRSLKGPAIAAGVGLFGLALTVGSIRFIEAAAPTTDVGPVARTAPSDAIARNESVAPRPMVHPSSTEQTDRRYPPPSKRARQTRPPSARTEATVARAVAPSTLPVSTDSTTQSPAEEQPLPTVPSRPTVTPAALGLSMSSATDTPDGSVSAVLAASEVKPASPWGAATDRGVAVGRASQKAAVATAGFFNRFGKKIAGAF